MTSRKIRLLRKRNSRQSGKSGKQSRRRQREQGSTWRSSELCSQLRGGVHGDYRSQRDLRSPRFRNTRLAPHSPGGRRFSGEWHHLCTLWIRIPVRPHALWPSRICPILSSASFLMCSRSSCNSFLDDFCHNLSLGMMEKRQKLSFKKNLKWANI